MEGTLHFPPSSWSVRPAAGMEPAGGSTPSFRPVPPWAQPGPWGCLGFALYLVGLLLSRNIAPGSGLGMKGQLLGILGLLVVSAPWLGVVGGRLRDGARGSSLLFYLFWTAVLVLIPFAKSIPISLAYLVLTFAVFAAAGNVWLASRRQLQVLAAGLAVLCFGFCLIPILRYGLGAGRGVGGLVPNELAAIACTPVLLCFVLPGWGRGLIYAGALALILYVNARGSLGAALLFAGVLESARVVIFRRWRAVARLGVALAVGLPVAVAVLLSSSKAQQVVTDPIRYALALDTPERALGSGLTGRTLIWREHMAEMTEHFVVGIGFRGSRASGRIDTSHSAVLDLVRECGVIGAGLFALFVAVRLLQLGRCVLSACLTRERREMAAGVLAAMLAVLFLAVFEAQLLNIGYPFGACALLLYAYQEPMPAGAAGV